MRSRRKYSVLMLAVVLASVLDANSSGQDADSRKQAQPATGSAMSAEKRKVALSMLKMGEVEARTLPPDLRCYALAQVARGYARLESSRAPQVLADAFASSYGLEPKITKPRLQRDILSQLFPLDRARVVELLPGAENSVRRGILLKLVREDIQTKKLDEAATLMEQMAQWSEYPYPEGSQLMKAFPSDQSWLRLVVFSRALASFSGRGPEERKQLKGNDEFTEMIANNWRDLPAGVVEQAIDEVLKQAKESSGPRYTTLPAKEGEVSFSSVYQLRLFQLLPILQQLNKPRAERILQDELLMGGLLAKYPRGPESLFPESDNGARKRVTAPVTPSAVSTMPVAGVGRFDNLQAEARRIVASAQEDPKQALAQAQTLPVEIQMFGVYQPIRIDALRGVANASLKSSPAVAREAIADMVGSAGELTESSEQVFQLAEAARLSLELGDVDRAKGALDSAASKANDAVKKDENSDDPNQALKAYWPSAVGWQDLLHIATHISPAYAQKLAHDIWDAQIRILATIAVADELAGAPLGHHSTMLRLADRAYYNDGAKVYANDDDGRLN